MGKTFQAYRRFRRTFISHERDRLHCSWWEKRKEGEWQIFHQNKGRAFFSELLIDYGKQNVDRKSF